MPPFVDFTGKRFGRLIAIERAASIKWHTTWKCKCDCGNYKTVRSTDLTQGRTKSCGCFRNEVVRAAQYQHKAPGVSAFNSVMGDYKASAKRRGFPFSLTEDEFRKLTSSRCWYCGDAPKITFKPVRLKTQNGFYTYNGVDRIDNSKGYETGNCVPCCKPCNVAKGSMTLLGFLRHVHKIEICSKARIIQMRRIMCGKEHGTVLLTAVPH